MKYDQRIRMLKAWMASDIATRFTPPNGLDLSIVVTDTVEAVNGIIQADLTPDQFRSRLDKIKTYLIKKAKTRALPTVPFFREAALNTAESHGEPRTVETTTLDDSTYLAKKIRALQPIPETALRGAVRQLLYEKHGITDDDLAPYRKETPDGF